MTVDFSDPGTKKLLASRIRENGPAISEWYSRHARANPPPIYCSVDLRDSGHKIAPVDSNLFPAGFNNICPEDLRTAPALLRKNLLARTANGTAKRVLIVPESNTKNLFYLENLSVLQTLLADGGFETVIGWLGEPVGALETESGKTIHPIPLTRSGNRLIAGDFDPDLILLNNDFSSGYPDIFDGIEQPVLPPHTMGWHTRKKSRHFHHYNRLATEFAQLIGIDPWVLTVETEAVEPVNFNEELGTEKVAEAVDRVISHLKADYSAHGIEAAPFTFVKNNAGTYGMGIMVVHSADEIRTMNRRTKNKMSVGKNRSAIHSVVVQEGIPTRTLVDRLAAEPVIYLSGCELIGGFLRTNTEKGDEDNLNSSGMVFRMLCMSDLRTALEDDLEDVPALELVYGTIARISALATGLELAENPQISTQNQGASHSGKDSEQDLRERHSSHRQHADRETQQSCGGASS